MKFWELRRHRISLRNFVTDLKLNIKVYKTPSKASSSYWFPPSISVGNLYNLVIELGMRADFDRNKLADVDEEHVDDSSLSGAVAAIPVGWFDGADDRFVITIGWQISVMGLRIVFALSAVAGVNERHLAMSKFRSGRCAVPARPAAKGNGTNRCRTWNLCSSRYFFEQKHR